MVGVGDFVEDARNAQIKLRIETEDQADDGGKAKRDDQSGAIHVFPLRASSSPGLQKFEDSIAAVRLDCGHAEGADTRFLVRIRLDLFLPGGHAYWRARQSAWRQRQ